MAEYITNSIHLTRPIDNLVVRHICVNPKKAGRGILLPGESIASRLKSEVHVDPHKELYHPLVEEA
jgi:hypothetical protein